MVAEFNLSGDILEIKVKDYSRRTLYKNKCRVDNKKEILSMLDDLKKFGISIEDVLKEVKRQEQLLTTDNEINWWK